MRLSDADRLMLWYQLEILKHLDKRPGAKYAEHQEIIERGYEGLYGEVVQPIDSKPVPASTYEEVAQILNMYRAISSSLDTLKKSATRHWESFQGFDGNNETEHFGLAEFLIDKQGKWSELKACPRNSHSETLDKYRSMLQVWKRRHPLTMADIDKIVAAE